MASARKRSRILIPVFIVATYGAFQVEPLLESGRTALAGAVFGLSAVALSLTTALQSIKMYRQSYSKLLQEGKLQLGQGQGLLKYALIQDFTNPARLGLFVGAIASPIAAAIVFTFFQSITSNGWVLAILGSTESIVASLTVFAAGYVNRTMFRQKIRRQIAGTVRGDGVE